MLFVAALFAAFPIAGTQQTSARSTAPDRPVFEVVSIRECRPGEPSPPSHSSPGRLTLGCWPLSRLIADAYETFANGKVDPFKLPFALPAEGAPNWVNSARYTIDAKAESPQSGAMMRGPMMQALLEDRFQIRVHRESKEVSGYVMRVDPGGLKLKAAADGSCEPIDPADLSQPTKAKPCNVPQIARKGSTMVFEMRGVRLDVFAQLLHPNGRPVIDGTGLSGAFDIHLEYDTQDAPDPDDGGASDPSPHATQMEAMRRQLGLRLVPGKGTRELLVIDRVEKPSSN